MADSYFSQLGQGLHTAIHDFAWRSPQAHTTLRAALSCTLAAFLAMWLQMDQPYWACISAFIVVQTFVGNTLQKALMRFAGTVLGAVLGLIIASVFIQQHFMVYLCLFVSGFVGIYLSCVDKQRMYVWLLGYITLMMVVFGGMADPSPEHFVSLAFNRSGEVIIGIVASLLVTYFVLPRHAKHRLQQETLTLAKEIEALFGHLRPLYLKDDKKHHDAIEQQVKAVIAKIERCRLLWQMGAQEGPAEGAHHYFRGVSLVTRLDTLFDLLVDEHRALHQSPNNAYLVLLSERLAPCLAKLQQCFTLLIADIDQHHAQPEALLSACDEAEAQWQVLVQAAEHHRQAGRTLSIDIEEVDAGCQALLALHMMLLEIRAVASPVKDIPQPAVPWRQHFHHAITRVLTYDRFYLKHAALGACALLFMPMVWLLLNLPGFAQIAVSIGAVIGMDPENTRYKGFLRMAGCGAGLIAALMMLALDMQSIGFLLLVVFGGTLLFGYVHYDKPQVSYFGTQAMVVFFIGTVMSLSPTLSMTIATERLAAIIMGVGSIVLFQQVFWRFRGKARCQHNVHQFQSALKPILMGVKHQLVAQKVYVHNTEPALVTMRLATRNLRETDTEVFSVLRQLFYRVYFLTTLVERSQHMALLMSLDSGLADQVSRFFALCITPRDPQQDTALVLAEIIALESYFVDLRKRLRKERLTLEHGVGKVFEIITLLSTLHQIATLQKCLLQQ